MEQPDAAERHGNAVLIAGVNDLLVADRAAGLDNGGHTGAAGTLDVVAKGEEGIRAQADTGNMAGLPSWQSVHWYLEQLLRIKNRKVMCFT